MNLNQLYSEIILEHSQKSPNKKKIDGANIEEKGHNPLCGDVITLYIKTDGDIITDASFTGQGCAISQASTSMLIDLIRGKKIDGAKKLVQEFTDMIYKKDVDLDDLGDAQALAGVSDFPARVKCALLPWKTLEEAVDEKQEKNNKDEDK